MRGVLFVFFLCGCGGLVTQDGGRCNDLSLVGPPVNFDEVPSAEPAFPSGGAPISDGVYVLVAMRLYTGPDGSSGTLGMSQATLRVTTPKQGRDFAFVSVFENQAAEWSNSLVTIAGPNQLAIAPYCPQSGPTSTVSAYFDGSTLLVRTDSGGGPIEEQLALVQK